MSDGAVRHDNPVPRPPFWGARCIERVPLRAVVPYINRTALYRFQWGLKSGGRDADAYRAWLRRTADPVLARLVAESEAGDILRPCAVYGYFPCQSEGEELIVYADPEGCSERCRFRFPRQARGRRLCIADFFRPRASGEMDVVAFQVVTVGERAAKHAHALFEGDRYQEYLYWHGFNVETTEALAEYVHKLIRAELGFAAEDARDIQALLKQGYRGARYSFGYPACPDLRQQVQILELLDAGRIGVALGEEDQLWPEESTSAIVVHHPQARYFAV